MSYFNATRFFDTCPSEVVKKTLFTRRWTAFIPDFFLLFFYISLFVTSGVVDRILMYLLFRHGSHIAYAIFILIPSFTPFVYIGVLRSTYNKSYPELRLNDLSQWFIIILFVICGLDPLLIGGRILIDTLDKQRGSTSSDDRLYVSYPFFHVTEENLCFIKLYCYLSLGLKVMPQLILVPLFLLHTKSNYFVPAASSSILVNMLIFSLTMALTLPIRKVPRIYSSSPCVLINAFSKFMAVLCSCGAYVAILAMVFQSVGYFSLFILLLKFVISGCPSVFLLKSYYYQCPNMKIILYWIYFSSIFSFIYIHPLEGKGKVYYYFFYLVNFLGEIACLYLYSDANPETVTMYLALRLLTIGFISCHGMINILHKNQCIFKLDK